MVLSISMTVCITNVISKEVVEQAINLVGTDSFSGLNVVPIQQQRNGSDCGVFTAAFATALVHGVSPNLTSHNLLDSPFKLMSDYL